MGAKRSLDMCSEELEELEVYNTAHFITSKEPLIIPNDVIPGTLLTSWWLRRSFVSWWLRRSFVVEKAQP